MNFFKEHTAGIFILSVIASLTAALIYDRVTFQTIVHLIGKQEKKDAVSTNTHPTTNDSLKNPPASSGNKAAPIQKAQIESTRQNSNEVAGRYRDHGDGTVTDAETGLMWQRCSVGQSWTGSTCSGEANRIPGVNLEKRAWAAFAGYSDWHLPQELDLSTLVYCSSGKPKTWRYVYLNWHPCEGKYQHPTIDEEVFPNTPSNRFWAANFDFVHFALGRNGFTYPGSGSGYVRLVRSDTEASAREARETWRKLFVTTVNAQLAAETPNPAVQGTLRDKAARRP